MKSSFASVLSRLRRDAGYNQRQVALELGVSQALLSHYENGAREPKLDFVVRVCDYYDVSADYLLGRTDDRGKEAENLTRAISEFVNRLEEIKKAEDSLINEFRQSTNRER